MGGVHLVGQRTTAYHLDCKSSISYFELIDATCANAFIVYSMMHQNDLTLLDYKTVLSTHVIGRYTSRRLEPSEQKARSKRKHQYHF